MYKYWLKDMNQSLVWASYSCHLGSATCSHPHPHIIHFNVRKSVANERTTNFVSFLDCLNVCLVMEGFIKFLKSEFWAIAKETHLVI